MFDPGRLSALHAVSEYGSIVAASEVLGYTPSAVSQQIAKLEREVGAPLLERIGRGVVLTDAAEVLVAATEKILVTTEEAQSALEAVRHDLVGTLTIRSFPTAVRGIGAASIRDLRSSAPGLRVRIMEAPPEEVLAAVVDGRADLGLVHDWSEAPLPLPPGLVVEQIGVDPVDVVVQRTHHLAGRTDVRLPELLDETWVTDVSRGICSQWLHARFSAQGRRPRIDFRASDYASHAELVSAGLCIALLPRLGRVALPETILPIGLAGTPLLRRIFTVHRLTSTRRPAIHAMTELLRDHLTKSSSLADDELDRSAEEQRSFLSGEPAGVDQESP